MKLKEIFRFELGYQLQNLSTWLIVVALLGLSFLITRDASLSEALHDDFFLNSPFSIAKTTVAGSLIWLLIAAGVAGEAAARDVSNGTYPLFYTSGASKAAYLGGRFFASLCLNAFILLAVQAGILLAVYLPGVDAALVGPFRPAAYLTAYVFIALPNAFAATAIQFWLAATSGRPMASYLGSVLLFFMSYVVGLFLLFNGRQDLANYLDPIGVHFILSELSHLWTPAEKSWRLVTLEGTVLTNRLTWVSIGVAAVVLTWLRFRFMHRSGSVRWHSWRTLLPGRFSRQKQVPANEYRIDVSATTHSEPDFGFLFPLRQTIAIAGNAFRAIAFSWAGMFLLLLIPLLTILVIIDQMDMNGVPLLPRTGRVLAELTAPLVADMSRWVIVPVLIIFFAGRLVWRERDLRIAEITDAIAGSEWPRFLGKFLALSLLLIVFLSALMGAGMIAQVMMGYQNFEPGLYVFVLFGLQLPEYLLFALLALVIHFIIDQKYIGHLAAILAWVLIALAPMFGIEHDLLIYGAGPGWTYTDMSGFAGSILPWLWFKLYWFAWAILLAVFAKLLMVRGREKSLGARIRIAGSRFAQVTTGVALVSLGLILTIGGFIFHNTNVLNEYVSRTAATKRSAEYERRYSQYRGTAQPSIAATNLRIEIYPDRRMADISGSYTLLNTGLIPIDTIHLATVTSVVTGPMIFDRKTSLLLDDEAFGHRIYLLAQPLQPGDSLRIRFEVRVKPAGFKETGHDPAIVANGTYFTNRDWLPQIGYQPGRELTSAKDRRHLRLPPRPLIASLYDSTVRNDRGLNARFEAVIGTSPDQVAIAPGLLRKSWKKDGRQYFQYASDIPIGGEQFFFSAKYHLRESAWKDTSGTGQIVTIRIYHHPTHTAHLDRTIASVKASLDYYTRQFGPYRHNQVTFVEQPGDGDGAGVHAVSGMLIYEEGFTFWNPGIEPGSLDHPYAVVAHEMAHQWTVPYANAEGAPVLSESVAWYYAMKAVQYARGQEQLEGLLQFMRQPHPHPPIRHGEPLLRGLDPYLSYRKGPFALYTLSEYIGEREVHLALRRLVENHFHEEAPLATTLDLYRELNTSTPDSLKYLLHDLFEVNASWDLKTNKVTAIKTASGAWQVKLDLQARKIVADSAGNEREVPMDEWIEIGIFAERSEDQQNRRADYLRKHRIRSGAQNITVTVPFRPQAAGIDPRYLLPDWEKDDNTNRATLPGG